MFSSSFPHADDVHLQQRSLNHSSVQRSLIWRRMAVSDYRGDDEDRRAAVMQHGGDGRHHHGASGASRNTIGVGGVSGASGLQ